MTSRQTNSRRLPRQIELLKRQIQELKILEHHAVQAVHDTLAGEHFNLSHLDQLPGHVAVLDRQGRVVAVGGSWRSEERTGAFAEWSDHPEAGLPANPEMALGALAAVLGGTLGQWGIEYPCQSPWGEAWVRLDMAPRPSAGGGAVVTHLEVTPRKLAELELAQYGRSEPAGGPAPAVSRQ